MTSQMDIEELVESFSFFDEWTDKYRYLIDLGRKLTPLDESLKIDAFRVEGCQSQVWLVVERDPGSERLRFLADSDSAIVKGLIALLLTLYSNKTPEDILQADVEGVFSRIGLDNHLSPNRRNGFFSMVGRIKTTAEQQIAGRG